MKKRMSLFFWAGLDVGGEYPDGWIGVIAATIAVINLEWKKRG